MSQDVISGAKLKSMFLSASQLIEENKKVVNELNVFPVPDGDTGTNMSLTIQSAARELNSLDNDEVSKVVDALSRGSLKGARGNSGVILSQLFRGFAKELKNESAVSISKFADALNSGVETAYKAVMKPVEGTILTVARVTADEAVKFSKDARNFNDFFEIILDVAKTTLEKTPEMLPVLKQAGVVDSGGMGLYYILTGFAYALDDDLDLGNYIDSLNVPAGSDTTSAQVSELAPNEDIEFGYCTEFFIKNLHTAVGEDDIEKLKSRLGKYGNSIVVVGDDDLIKIHFHTNDPGKGLQLGLKYGDLSGIKIDNMREQHRHIIDFANENISNTSEKNLGMLAVAIGKGITSIFKDLNTDYVIEGGQTMNPSIQDILNAVDKVNAKELFILPNNSNIVLSARQAAEISEKPLHVIPTKSIPQGLSALIAYNPDLDADMNVGNMTEAITNVKSGQVTYSIRNSQVKDLIIKENDIMGLLENDIVIVGDSITNVTKGLIDKMIDSDEIITLLYGKDAKDSETEEIVSYINKKYPNVEVEVLPGDQPLYYYIISVE